MIQKVFVFKTKATHSDGRPYLLAIPENQITELRSIVGNQNAELSVNGTRVTASFDDLAEQLGKKVHMF
jgi:hypothetical protein